MANELRYGPFVLKKQLGQGAPIENGKMAIFSVEPKNHNDKYAMLSSIVEMEESKEPIFSDFSGMDWVIATLSSDRSHVDNEKMAIPLSWGQTSKQ